MPLARVNGIHLFYDEAGAGRPVIFVHAYPMGRTIPKAELHVMRGCGHFNNLERPAEVNRVLETFFRKIGWEG